ncbi:uncharacterized protein B0I36DRAFT_386073 [Microdochium trichocladiopsis]|uniref:Zn(2)-C6 fungal-type domain-containing protein n=1 Tax=Microdochium trichocladiopsis TaxID=1682393 RepID=A0A9P9BQ98_9PEZI|nr:uncharacterized protein B0I36DRAFT_386073 [Microdochium trichocladiopsis]KAH7025647.1 hypothetical protein B0I36DRAFT_386073 [Microdochium trichocladiopsis]
MSPVPDTPAPGLEPEATATSILSTASSVTSPAASTSATPSLRQLLPASGGGGSIGLPKSAPRRASSHVSSPAPHKDGPRKSSVLAACDGCRRRKVKCSGERPVCFVCSRRGIDCHYTTSVSETHGQALKRRYNQLHSQEAPHRNLVELLKNISDEQALAILRRLQAGDQPELVLGELSAGSALLELVVKPETRYRQVQQPTTIATAAGLCLVQFRSCLDQAAIIHPRELSLFEDQLARFSLWTANIRVFGPSRQSLDHRLREASEVFDIVQALLETLHYRLEACISALEALGRDGKIQVNTLAPVDDALEQAIESVAGQITLLHKLSNTIRRASKQASTTEEAVHFVLRNDEGDDIEAYLHQVFLMYLRDRFQGATEAICQRLATTMLLRRRKILYRRAKYGSGSITIAEPSQGPKIVLPNAGNSGSGPKPSHIPPPSQARSGKAPSHAQSATTLAVRGFHQASTPSIISMSKTVAFTRHDALSFPLPPLHSVRAKHAQLQKTTGETAASKGTQPSSVHSGRKLHDTKPSLSDPVWRRAAVAVGEITCPYCFYALPAVEVMDDQKWKMHVKGDLDPYVCLFDNCNTPHELYAHSAEWIRHMKRHALRWRCASKAHADHLSTTPQDYIEHLRSAHKSRLSDNQLRIMADRSASTLGPLFPACPLCGATPGQTGVSGNIEEHIVGHLRDIAIKSLPIHYDEFTENGEGEQGSSAPSGHDTRTTIQDERARLREQGLDLLQGGSSSLQQQEAADLDDELLALVGVMSSSSDVSSSSDDAAQSSPDEEAVRCVCGHDDYPGPPPFEPSGRRSLKDESVFQRIFRGHEDMGEFFIQCDLCKTWSHTACIGMASNEDIDQFFCSTCRSEWHLQFATDSGRKYSIFVQQPSSYWPIAEEIKFSDLLQSLGSDWASIAAHLGTKTTDMVERYFNLRKGERIDWQTSLEEADARIAAQQRRYVTNPIWQDEWPGLIKPRLDIITSFACDQCDQTFDSPHKVSRHRRTHDRPYNASTLAVEGPLFKSYFLTPSWDYPPDGPLKLGNIIISPVQPVPALVSVPISTGRLTETGPSSSPRESLNVGFRSTKQNVSWSREKQLSGQFGVWTSFLQFVGVNVGLDISRGSSELFEFDQMITEEHYPSDEDLSHAISSSPRAMQFLQRHGLRRARGLYVVVGVKTVTGARVTRRTAREAGIEGQVSADGLAGTASAAAGLPVSLGPSMGFSKAESDETSFTGSEDFVFAFRVRRIKIKVGGDGIDQEDYKKGVMYSNERLANDDSSSDPSLLQFSVAGIAEDDSKGVEHDMEMIRANIDQALG